MAVGIGEYAEKGLTLNHPVKDARALAELLRTRGEKLFDRVDVVPVFDRDATKATIEDPAKRTKYLKSFTLYVDGDEVYPNETADALEADLPILAICRGVQVMNVAVGGTLVQDIPSGVEGAVSHQVPMPKHAIAHEVWVNRESLLWSLMEERLENGDTLGVNSRHHQAVKAVADGFVVSATAPDGAIEAIERPGHAFCVGVQWHPENFWRTGEFTGLFDGLIHAARHFSKRATASTWGVFGNRSNASSDRSE